MGERPAGTLAGVVETWLARGATAERLGEGYRLTHPDEGRALCITPEGLASLPGWLRQRLADDAEERAAIKAERPAAWEDEDDAPRLGDWCARCRGKRWWRPSPPSALAPGWRCATCHPAPPGAAVAEVST